jgi:hypothetical protein
VVAGNDCVGLLPCAFEFACYVENSGLLLNCGSEKNYCEHIDE